MYIIFYPFSKVRRIRGGDYREQWKNKAELIAELEHTRAELRDMLCRSLSRRNGRALYYRGRLRALHQLSLQLSSCNTIDEAGQAVLRTLCASEGWDIGTLWLLDEAMGALRPNALWHPSDVAIGEFKSFTGAMRVQLGQGLLGRIWQSGAPIWFFELGLACRSARTMAAVKEGMRWAYYFPIHDGEKVCGMFEFYSDEPRTPDDDQLRAVVIAGKLLIQSISRMVFEAKRHAYDWAIEGVENHALCHLGDDGRIVSWSGEAERLLGYSADEAMGQPHMCLYPAEDAVVSARNLSLAAKEGQARMVGLRERKDGTRFWADVLLVPIRSPSGELTGFSKLIHNLGEFDEGTGPDDPKRKV